MAQIYFVETKAQEQRGLLCLWVERLYENGRRVQVAADSTMAAQHLDQMLWTFTQESFIPHCIATSKLAHLCKEPVIITVGETHLEGMDVLVSDVPVRLEFIKLYPATVHFVLRDDEDRKQESRLMWHKAKDQGFILHHVPYSGNAKLPATLVS